MITEQLERLFVKWMELEKRTRTYGTKIALHPSEIHTIEVIGQSEDLNITQIASKLGIRLASASEIITKLKKKGLVLKYNMEDNKKEKLVRLTPLGRQAFEGHAKFHQQYEDGESFLAKYPEQDKLYVITDFLDYCEKLYDRMLNETESKKY